MQKSLTMLANVVDYEDKKLQLEGLKNRLEAIASPRLVQAFTAANLGKTCKIEINSIILQIHSSYNCCIIFRTIQNLRRYLWQDGTPASASQILSQLLESLFGPRMETYY